MRYFAFRIAPLRSDNMDVRNWGGEESCFNSRSEDNPTRNIPPTFPSAVAPCAAVRSRQRSPGTLIFLLRLLRRAGGRVSAELPRTAMFGRFPEGDASGTSGVGPSQPGPGCRRSPLQAALSFRRANDPVCSWIGWRGVWI